jgi:hypothetical protein
MVRHIRTGGKLSFRSVCPGSDSTMSGEIRGRGIRGQTELAPILSSKAQRQLETD